MKTYQWNSKQTWLAAWIGVWMTSMTSYAQTSQYLSLESALQQAEQQNTRIRMAEMDQKIGHAQFRQTDAVFLPQVSVSYQALTTNNPLHAFGFLLQQREVTAQHFSPEQMNHPSASQNYGASADIQWPILNLDRIYARKGAKAQKEVYQHQANHTRNYMRYEVQKAYTQLQFAYQTHQVLQQTLQDVKEIHRSVQNFHEQGLVQVSDVLNAQVQVNTIESALQKATSNIHNASDGLALLMGTMPEDAIQIFSTDSLRQYQPVNTLRYYNPLRSDILAMQSALDASKAQVQSAVLSFLPKINAFGSYQFNDRKFFGFKEDSYLIGINLSWTLYSGNQRRQQWRKASFQRNKLQMELELYKNQSKLEVERNARTLKDLQVEINKQTTSLAQAREALRILKNRHQEGLVSTTDLLTQQAQESQHQLALAEAIMNYNITYYYHELLTTNP